MTDRNSLPVGLPRHPGSGKAARRAGPGTQGGPGLAEVGPARIRLAKLGLAKLGLSRLGLSRLDLSKPGLARPDRAKLTRTRLNLAGLGLAGLMLAGCEVAPQPSVGAAPGYGYTCYAGVYVCHTQSQVAVGSPCSCPGLGAPSFGHVQ